MFFRSYLPQQLLKSSGVYNAPVHAPAPAHIDMTLLKQEFDTFVNQIMDTIELR